MRTFTIADCISQINQALNYPSLTYEDISLYLDQAIAEINTNLHIGLRSFSHLISYKKNNKNYIENMIILDSIPTESTTVPVSTEEVALSRNSPYFYNSNSKQFGILDTATNTYKYYPDLFAVYNNGIKPTIYKATILSTYLIMWIENSQDNPLNINLLDYLPEEWIILFIVPYVCFKYAVRDGGTGGAFSDEFSQGYSQLIAAYNVPSFVFLPTVADLPAYTEDVKDNLPCLNVKVPTRAIFDTMKNDRVVMRTGRDFYDRGGW